MHDPTATPDQTTLLKLALIWAGTIIGSITLQEVVLALTGVFTLLQIAKLVRDELRARRSR